MPEPQPTCLPLTFSPVPTQTTSGLLGSRATVPMENDFCSSKTGAHVVPAFVVFHDATLRHLLEVRPQTLAAMRHVHGIGEAKLARYGERFLDVVREYGPALRKSVSRIRRPDWPDDA